MRMMIVLAAAALASAPALAGPPEQLAPPSPELAAVDLRAADVKFLLQAAAFGSTEVKASELALQRSQDPAVRELARHLLQDHRQANAQLLQVAGDHGVAVPREPSGAQRGMLAALAGVRARDFDQQFIERAGVNAHGEAIALFHAQMLRPDPDPDLQRFASATLPVLQHDLQLAQATLAHAGRSDARPSDRDEARGAQDTVSDAVQAIQALQRDPKAAVLLQQAHGILVLPHDRRAALGIGVRGGKGVLVTRHAGGYSEPAFYTLGGISAGLQAGLSGGGVVYLLMSDRAVQQFRSNRTASLTADAGLTIGSFAARRHGSDGKLEDVLVWSDASGAYAGASIGVTGIVPDPEANRAYYGREASSSAILGGLVDNPHGNILGAVLGV